MSRKCNGLAYNLAKWAVGFGKLEGFFFVSDILEYIWACDMQASCKFSLIELDVA